MSPLCEGSEGVHRACQHCCITRDVQAADQSNVGRVGRAPDRESRSGTSVMMAGPGARALRQGTCPRPKEDHWPPSAFARASPCLRSPRMICPSLAAGSHTSCSRTCQGWLGCTAGGCGCISAPAHSCWSGRVLVPGSPLSAKRGQRLLGPVASPL